MTADEKSAMQFIDEMVLAAIGTGSDEASRLEARFSGSEPFKECWDRLSLVYNDYGSKPLKRDLHRVIDQSLQRLRKKGKIRFCKHDRTWGVVVDVD